MNESIAWCLRWFDRYYDAVSGYSMISVLVPVYIDDDWQGAMCADIILSQTQALLAAQRPTANSHIFAIAPNGGIVSAESAAYDYIFCPDSLQPLCNGTTFEILEYSTTTDVLNSIGLADSHLGFSQILTLINTPNMTNLQTITLRGLPHYVSWSSVNDQSLPYIVVVVTPTTDIEYGM
jgi:hypothetical protein